ERTQRRLNLPGDAAFQPVGGVLRQMLGALVAGEAQVHEHVAAQRVADATDGDGHAGPGQRTGNEQCEDARGPPKQPNPVRRIALPILYWRKVGILPLYAASPMTWIHPVAQGAALGR